MFCEIAFPAMTIQPIQGWLPFLGDITQGGPRCGRPWALRCNAFGVINTEKALDLAGFGIEDVKWLSGDMSHVARDSGRHSKRRLSCGCGTVYTEKWVTSAYPGAQPAARLRVRVNME